MIDKNKHEVSILMGRSPSNAQREIYNLCLKKEARSQLNNLTFYLRHWKKNKLNLKDAEGRK